MNMYRTKNIMTLNSGNRVLNFCKYLLNFKQFFNLNIEYTNA